MRQCKDYMKVRGVNDFCPSLIHPDFFYDSLTIRTVAVATGIVVKLSMTAVGTLADVIAKISGFTVRDGMRGF